jgi:glycosyltransferase involved in cell wall biosynthesis
MTSEQKAQNENGRPLISVIMPCHNAAHFVAEAVGSVMGQSWGNVELIVVDDGSRDASAEIVEHLAAQHPGRIRLFFTHHLGPYPARNTGLRHARGDYIAFLDADDWWLPETLEKLHAALTENNTDLAYCGWQNVGEGIKSAPYVPPEYEALDPVDAFVKSCPWPIHAALLRRRLVEQLGGFSERRFSSMDYDFWLRVLANTRRIKRVPEVMAFYRWHNQGQVSSVKWRQVLDALAAQKDFIHANPKLVAHLSPARIQELTEGQVLRKAYQAFWKRDLVSAHKLFRHAGFAGAFKMGDLRHILTAVVMPLSMYQHLVGNIDRKKIGS